MEQDPDHRDPSKALGDESGQERKPPRSLEIPAILRDPVDHPSLRPKAPSPTMSAIGELGRALAIGLDPLFVCAAGALIGWLIDRWLGSGPAGLLIGLIAGLAGGTWRLIVRLNQDEAKAKREAGRPPPGPRS